MAIEKMTFVTLRGSATNIEQIIPYAFKSPYFHPELASNIINDSNNYRLMDADGDYEQYLRQIEALLKSLNCNIDSNNYDNKVTFTKQEIEKYINDATNQYQHLSQQINLLAKLTEDDVKAISALKSFDLKKLHQLKFSAIFFGRMPLTSYDKLINLSVSDLTFDVIAKNKHDIWLLIAVEKSEEAQEKAILNSLYFEELLIPEFDEKEILKSCEFELSKIYGYVAYKAKIQRLHQYIAIDDDKLVIAGFVSTRNLKQFKTGFGPIQDVRISEEDASNQSRLTPPTLLRNNFFAKPFEMFVNMYSLPSYGDLDPTFFFSITYCILFGIMFGDVGQGLVLILLGFILSLKKPEFNLFKIMTRIGFFATFFGFIFGSVFGNEEILAEIYAKYNIPLPINVMDKNVTMPLLLTTLAIGATLIIISMLINTINKLRQKDFAQALISQNGLCGLLIYVTGIVGFSLLMMANINIFNIFTILFLIVIPAILLLFMHPVQNFINKMKIKPHDGWANYLVESFFECFEIALSFVSNTLSFMRVGGFIFSHTGLMMVVYILKDMTAGSELIVLILGNIFVMALEGLIVGIQTLRLEYYEMFSRYYSGNGRPFQNVILENTNQ